MEIENKEQEQEHKIPVKKKSYIKKIWKVFFYVIISIIALNMVLYGLLSIPAIQNKALGFAISKIKEKVKTEVRVDRVRISILNHIDLTGIYIEDQSKDTLIYAKNLEVSLHPWQLLKGKLLINDINLDNFTVKVSQNTPESNFNFQFLIDAFSSDSTKNDTTASSLQIDIESVKLKNGKLSYRVDSDTITPGIFNASHINISGLNALLKLPSVDMANLKVELNSLSFRESSGLFVKNLQGRVTSDKENIYLKDASLELPNSKLEIPEGDYNLISKAFHLASNQSKISPADLTCFMPDLKYLRHPISLKTNIEGVLPAIQIKDLILSYGEKTTLEGDAYISDYSQYGNADLKLDIKKFRIDESSIGELARLGDSTFVSPDMLKTMEDIHLNGILSGNLSNLQIEAEAWFKQGFLQMNAKASTDTAFQNFLLDAQLKTQNFNLGSLLEMPDLGRLSGDVDLQVSQKPKQDLKIEARGNIRNIQYNKENFNNIPFSAFYNSQKMGVSLKADLPQGLISGEASMTQGRNAMVDMDLDIRNLKLDYFYANPEWKNPLLSMNLKGYVKGFDLKNIQADVAIKDLRFSRDSLTFAPGDFTLKAGASDDSKKYIQLNSSLLRANLHGEYDFMSFSEELSRMMNAYLPGIFKKKVKRRTSRNNFDFSIRINNTEEFGRILDLPVDVITPLDIAGNINTSNNTMQVLANLPLLKAEGLPVENTVFQLTNSPTTLNLTGNSRLKLDSGDIKFELNSTAQSDSISTSLFTQREGSDLKVDIPINFISNFQLDKKNNLRSYVQFKSDYWDIGKLKLLFTAAQIINENEKTSISNLGLMEGIGRISNKYISLDGVVSSDRRDTLNISFFNSNIGKILSAFNINDISTIIFGDVKVANVLDKPEMYTKNLILSNIIVWGDTLGDFKVKSRWSNLANAIGFDAALEKNNIKSVVQGLVYPQKDSLRLNLNLDRFSIAWMQPFMPDILNRASGTISTGLTAIGKIGAPRVQGWLGVNDVSLGLDYTNVTYHISDTIDIDPDRVGLYNLIIEDSNHGIASLNALLTHKDFKNIKYKLDARLVNFMVLNTADRTDSLFYGKVFASGTVKIDGSDDQINVNMDVQNRKNSFINVQIPQTSEASVYENIVYINTPPVEKKEVVEESEPTLPLKLAVNLNVNPNILLNVVINPLTGDAMQVKGSGLVKFSYDMESEVMNAFGDYTLSDGTVKLKLQNIATMAFKIRPGSKLIFNGDPLLTNFDITAYKRVRANLTSLDASFGMDQNNSPKVVVDCVLGITGNMNKMNLTYDIELPEASDDIKQRVKSLVSTNDQKIRQFAYLIAMNMFYPEGSNTNSGNIATGLATNMATSTISSVLNSVLGNIVGGDWQIGANISSSDGNFSDMDMSVSLSKKFLDDRLEFNTNLGYRTDQTSNNSFIGDFDVAYSLNNFLKLKVFNKTNDKYYQQAPTTQGIGIMYTKEAKTFRQLFQYFKKKKHPSTNPAPPTSGSK